MNKKTFNLRSFVSISTFFFFISLALSGIVVKITDHQPYSFGKIYGITWHNVSAIGFLVFATWHLVKNWKSLRAYMSGTAQKVLSKEMLTGFFLFLLILLLCLLRTHAMVTLHGI